MSSKTKSVTAVLIVLALVAGVGMTKAGSKYKTQDKVKYYEEQFAIFRELYGHNADLFRL